MTRKHSFIPFCVALPTALALWAYFYTVSLPFRVVFLKHSVGPLLLWQTRSPFSLSSIVLFTVFLTAIFFTCLILQRNKRPLVPFVSFWVLGFTPLLLSPLSTKFPEFIPLALVLLPASSVAAFLVLIFWRQRTGSETPSREILGPRLAPYIVWIITFFVLVTSGLFVCERSGYKGGDVKYYFTIAASMHQDHDIDMANNIRDKRKRPAPRYHISKYSSNGHAYSWHPVGLPFILAPFLNEVQAEKIKKHDFREALIIMCIIGAFLASQMYLAVSEETGNAGISLLVWIALSFSSPLWFYSFSAWPFAPGALCMLYAWRRMHNFRENRFYQIVILNLLLAWLLWLHETFILCYGILGMFLLYHWLRKLRESRMLVTVIFQAFNLGIYFWFHYRWYGKHLFGQDGKVLSFWPGMLAVWFDHCRGMVSAGPIHLLCFILIFVYALRRRNLSGFVLLALYTACFVVGTATWHWLDPFNHPGRRLVAIIPLTCVPLGYFLKRRKSPTFYWLVTFLSLLSLSYMSFFIMNPAGLRLPIGYLPLLDQWFRVIRFNLPSFGRSFHNFPWTHVGAVTASFALFTLFWVLLLAKEARGNKSRTFPLVIKPGPQAPGSSEKVRDKPVFLFTGMWMTLIWIFVSIGWMKTHFDTLSPVPWNTITNCVGKDNLCGIGHPPLERGLYRYLVYGLDQTQEKLSWSIQIKKRLPDSLDLAKGTYRFHITGTGEPFSKATVTILEVSYGKELRGVGATLAVTQGGDKPHPYALVDANGNFSNEAEIDLSRTTNRIRVELKPKDEGKQSQIIFREMTITPIPVGLESLISKIEEKGEPSGWVFLD